MHCNHRYNSEHNAKAKEFLLSQLKPRFSETNSPSRIKSKPVTVIIMDIILGSLCDQMHVRESCFVPCFSGILSRYPFFRQAVMCVWSRVNCFAAKMAHLLAAFCQDVSSFRQAVLCVPPHACW